MSENFIANPGTGGDTFAADDIAGVKYPRSKIVIGADGANDGDVSASNPLPVLNTANSGIDIGDVTINNASGGSAVNIQDGGNSITIDGSVAQSGSWILSANSGVDIGDVTINNAAGASAVNVQDGGNSLTVDGTITANLAAGTNNIGDVDVLTLPAIPTGTNTIGSVKITDGTLTATVRDTGSSDSLNVAIVDGSGAHITSFGGGTQYTEADTDATITGTAVMWEDTSDTLRAVSAAKPLPVNVVAGGAGDGAILDGVSSSIKATVLDYTNSNPIAVRLTDTGGDYVGAGAGTQYTEDVAAAADPVGTMLMAVRADSLAAVTNTDGDNIAVRADNNGQLRAAVDLTSILGSAIQTSASGTLLVGNGDAVGNGYLSASATMNQSSGAGLFPSVIVGQFDDVSPTAITEGRFGNVRMSTRRELYGQIRDAAGNERGANVDAAGNLNVIAGANSGVDIGDVTINNASGAAAVNIQDGGNSITVDGAITANLAAGTNNIGDVDVLTVPAPLNVVGGGTEAAALRVTVANNSTGLLPVSQATASNLNAQVVGAVANGSADSGNPLKIGGVGRTTNPTAVTDGQRVNASFDDLGRQLMVIGQVRDLMTHQHTQIASSSSETTILTAVASTFLDLTQLVLTNQTATAVNVTIKDSTAGTTRMIIALAASGGAVIPFHRPVTQAAVNTNWTATLSSAAVTVNIFAQAEKNV